MVALGSAVSSAETIRFSLSEAVERALSAQMDVRKNKMEGQVLELEAEEVRLRENPALELEVALMPFKGNWDGTDAGGPKEYNLVVSWPVDFAGLRRLRMAQHRELRKAFAASSQDLQREIKKKVKKNYILALSLGAKVQLLRELQRDFTSLVISLERRVQARDRLAQ